MSEMDMEKDFLLEGMDAEGQNEMVAESDDFGLDEFSSDIVATGDDDLAEYAFADIEEVEEVETEKIASCFPNWSLTPEEMFKMDESSSKKKRN